VKIGLVAHGLSGVQNCAKYSAREKGLKSQGPKRMRVVDLKVDRWQLVPVFGEISFGSFEVGSV
jgi:hypothetical protein